MKDHKQQRIDILTALYSARHAEPKAGWVTMYDLRNLFGNCEFAIIYLTERELIRADGHRYQITAAGMDAVEEML